MSILLRADCTRRIPPQAAERSEGPRPSGMLVPASMLVSECLPLGE